MSRRSRSVILVRVGKDAGAVGGDTMSTNSMLETLPGDARDIDTACFVDDFGVGLARRGGVSGSGELEICRLIACRALFAADRPVRGVPSVCGDNVEGAIVYASE